ncbi:Universal stress protein A-like protein [Ananas comosus]|uniref:Universal stress protein A-like protein n=1 Tax=Ananas comosus TaxID=4615 RepID=A0A199VJN2_ANACO|nr:Universal stress protein A-like protein [Ananas comosus]
MAIASRRIVVAVDESEESMYALSWCLKNIVAASATDAAEHGGDARKDTIVLLHARRPRTIYPPMDGTGYLFSADIVEGMERYGAQLSKSVMEKAKQLCAEFPDVVVETRVESGDPRDVICEAVESIKPDILVMGSHGYGPIKRAFLGIVSSHCAQHVKCPVLIVKMPKH